MVNSMTAYCVKVVTDVDYESDLSLHIDFIEGEKLKNAYHLGQLEFLWNILWKLKNEFFYLIFNFQFEKR